MSTPKSNSPTLVCRLIRIRAALTSHSSPRVQQHCTTCADCRDHFNAADQLERRLRVGAATARTTAPATLPTRIVLAAQRSKQEERRPRLAWSWALGGLAAAAIAVVAIVQRPDPAQADASAVGASIEDVLAVANDLPKQWLGTLRPDAVRFLEDNPLQTEITSVRSDARSALTFLAMNFLPSDGASGPDETQPQPRRSS